MNKNIIWVAVWALFPLNQATSMDNPAEEQTPRLKRDGSSIVVLPMHGETREEGFKRARSNTIVNHDGSSIVVLPTRNEVGGERFKRARSNTTVGLDEVESDKPQLKFKGYYPALSNSDDIFSHVTLSKFFMHFNPGKDAKATARALRIRGIRMNSSFETVQQKYSDHLKELIEKQNEDPAEYIEERDRMISYFNEMYSGIVRPYVRIIRDEEHALAKKAKNSHADQSYLKS